jgi:hypothetical protein
MKVIPRSRYEFVLALYRENLRIRKTEPENAQRMNVRWTGTLPFAAAEVYGHLVADMRYLRKARLEGKDTAFLEQTCAFYVAWMGHYIGDGSQPLHDTIHHDGWQGRIRRAIHGIRRFMADSNHSTSMRSRSRRTTFSRESDNQAI